MTEMTFYHNVRLDGGVRTGVTVEGFRGLEVFHPGPGEPDPRLAWSVTVTVPSDRGVATQDDAAEWLASEWPMLQVALSQAAAEIPTGTDFGWKPWLSHQKALGRGAEVSLTAMRVSDHRDLGRNLNTLATEQLAGIAEELRACLLSEA